MVENLENQEKNRPMRDAKGRILPGHSGNPNGRPKGETMKEFSRQWFFQMSNEEKIAYIANIEKVRPGFAWTMSEGNPTEDKTVTIKVPTPILGGSTQAITTPTQDVLESTASNKDNNDHVAQYALSDVPTQQVIEESIADDKNPEGV